MENHLNTHFQDQNKKALLNDPGIYEYESLWQDIAITKTPSGQPYCNMDNALRVLENHPGLASSIWYDAFYGKIFTTWKNGRLNEVADADVVELTMFMQRYIGLKRITKDSVFDAVVIHGRKNARNAPKDWMESLVWDNTPRVQNLFSTYFGASDNEYSKAVSANFLISLVARVYRPGCKVDNMVVLEGGQGSFKSTACEILVGKELYCDASESVMSKDFLQMLQGKLLIEIAELDSFTRAEVTTVKRMITCKSDRYRASYGRITEDHPRQCVFIGTTNEDTYLRDVTGARRFWPVEIGKININLLEKDRDQLFAEAVLLFKEGASWWEVPKDAAKCEQESRRQIDPWEEVIAPYLVGKSEVLSIDVATNCLNLNPKDINRSVSMRIADVLKSLGCKNQVVWVGRKAVRVWKSQNSSIEAKSIETLQPIDWKE